MRIIPLEMNTRKRFELIDKFEQGVLKHIHSGETLEYYIKFNASGRKDVEEQQKAGKYFLMSMDGQLFYTDGQTANSVFSERSDAKQNTEVTIKTPVSWDILPENALLIQH